MRLIAVFTVAGLALAASTVHAASFDCARARAADEKAICANRALNDADVKMTTLLAVDEHLVAMGARGNMQDDQRDWLKARHTCGGNVKCPDRVLQQALGPAAEDVRRHLFARTFLKQEKPPEGPEAFLNYRARNQAWVSILAPASSPAPS